MNEEARKFQEIMWSLEVIDQLADGPEIKDTVVRDLADEN